MIGHYREQIFSNHVGPAWLQAFRREAFERFENLGYPSMKQESWKYTNPKLLAETQFASMTFSEAQQQWASLAGKNFSKQLSKNRLLFFNGYLVESHLSEQFLQSKIFVSSLREILEKDPERLQKYLTQDFSQSIQPFFALNQASLQDGAFIEVPAGLILEEPIELCFISSFENSYSVSHPHNLIVAAKNSQLTIIENYLGTSSTASYWNNASTRVIAAENAVVSHYRLQQESPLALHLGTLKIVQEASSCVNAFNFSLGGQLARFEIDSALMDEGAACNLNGLYIAQDTQHVDHQTSIDHLKPHCTSQETFKGILDGKAQGVFNGSIVVRPGAQKTYSNLINRNLLLSQEALINTKPLLEIFANDVKCSHGATIGRLDETQVFYLRSRGISEKLARALLTYAFAAEVFREIKVESVKQRLEDFLLGRLHIDSVVQEVLL